MNFNAVEKACSILEHDLASLQRPEVTPEAVASEEDYLRRILYHSSLETEHVADSSWDSDRRKVEVSKDDRHDHVLQVLAQACNLVRNIHPKEPKFHDIVERVNRTINMGINLVHRPCGCPLPSFAHSTESSGFQAELVDRLSLETEIPDFHHHDPRQKSQPPDPWFTTPRPHERSSELSRFHWDFPSPSHPSPLVNAMIQARCEISSTSSCLPTSISNSESCLILPCKGAWRSRTPYLAYYLLDDTSEHDFPLTARYAPDLGFPDIYGDEQPCASAADEVNKLMFIADYSQVKSFAWADSQSGEIFESGRPAHTLSTSDHHGPLCVFAPRRLLRAGAGSVAFWNLDDIETHDPEGFQEVDPGADYEFREAIPSGSQPTTVIQLADTGFSPVAWHIHPSQPGSMLCAPELASSIRDYSCISLDLDSAKAVDRYLGHAGSVEMFSTSETDPKVFLTAATDGYVRLYDTRLPLPTISLRAEHCKAAILVHPDGIPVVFTGSYSDQVVSLWDIRSSKIVYELSTGNNEVNGMTWDDTRNVLYVSTICPNLDKNCQVDPCAYREAEIPASYEMEDTCMSDDEGDSDYVWPC
ncbi:hypothetical protein C8R44DRAFT_709009 [Mycena epipterygia]|nr:hypothetical protein C8R44DRAFT_709009 [Mycena epipterygia]